MKRRRIASYDQSKSLLDAILHAIGHFNRAFYSLQQQQRVFVDSPSKSIT